MFTDVDPHLVGVLRASMALTDALRDLGAREAVSVRLSREDGLALLRLVAGASHTEAEIWSQQGRPVRAGFHSLKISGLTFEWPSAVLTGHAAANDNLRIVSPAQRAYGQEDDAPALR